MGSFKLSCHDVAQYFLELRSYLVYELEWRPRKPAICKLPLCAAGLKMLPSVHDISFLHP